MTGAARLRGIDEGVLGALQEAVGPGIVTHPAPARYLEEPRGKLRGHPGSALARPRTTRDVSRLLAQCNRLGVPVVPHGGGTGLVGGQVMAEIPPLILSLERMKKVRALSVADDVMVVEAGAVLADVQAAAEAAGRLFPLAMASQGSCTIGGNLATNAGGVQVLRYGNARALCLGIEAVLADGTIHHGLKALHKDNTGYDLRDLLVGSEGTLGVITAAALKLHALPSAHATAFLAVQSPQAALDLFHTARAALDERLTAFELISAQSFAFMEEKLPDIRRPLASPPPWSVLMEAAGSDATELEGRLLALIEAAMEAGRVTDGTLARSERERQALWHFRESIPLANRAIGAIASHDISLPLGEIPAFLDTAPAVIEAIAPVRINAFGHLGDGNLHCNFFPPAGRNREEFRALAPVLSERLYEMVTARGGSISAEHGIGRFRVADLARFGDAAALASMRAIKSALDPRGILNPGAVLPMED